jgi:hypothetical protein
MPKPVEAEVSDDDRSSARTRLLVRKVRREQRRQPDRAESTLRVDAALLVWEDQPRAGGTDEQLLAEQLRFGAGERDAFARRPLLR